jgi:hypothetical protein
VWRRSSPGADGKRLIGHAGAVLLRRCADRTGLTQALAKVLPSSTAAGWRDRAGVLVQLAVAIVLGAATLRTRYPRFDDFLRVRAGLDPAGVFANPYLDRVLGSAAGIRGSRTHR